MHLSFPSQEEIAAKSVAATAAERAEGMKWIGELLKPGALPEGLDGHLLPVKDAILAAHATVIGSGYPGSPPGGVKLTSGFVVKYEIQGYAFQVMESRGKVIVGVRDLSDAPAKTSEADRVAFVEEVVARFIKPPPADPFIVPPQPWPSAIFGFYSPVKRRPLPAGNNAYDPEQMKRSSFSQVKFATDGKAVILEAYKNLPFGADYMRPRFSALAAPPPAGP
jgi:hypothetical protein